MPSTHTSYVRHVIYLSALVMFGSATIQAQDGSKPHEGKPSAAQDINGDANIQTLLARGKSIYDSSCADCHGDAAQGVEGVYDSPLEGDLPVVGLSQYVTDTMPEGEPETCTGEDARLVSQYLHHAFYSRAARLKNNPPKIAFSRRTVQQYQNAVADIMKQLKWQPVSDHKRGLNAKYFGTRKLYKEGVKVEKVEPVIDFDYGQKTPYPEKLTDESQFSVLWEGGLIAKETGIYEFIVTSPNGFRLSINKQEYTIDNNVNSAVQTEFKASMKLAGELNYLLTKLAETPDPGTDHSLLDNTLVIWTNELGKGNSHSLQNIPFLMVGGAEGFQMGRYLKLNNQPHNRLWLQLAHAFGHHIETFGNRKLCEHGPLKELALRQT